MVSDIYMFDLETFHWERLPQSPEDDIPQARYFHSADTCPFSNMFLEDVTDSCDQGATISSFSAVWQSSLSPTTLRIYAC